MRRQFEILAASPQGPATRRVGGGEVGVGELGPRSPGRQESPQGGQISPQSPHPAHAGREDPASPELRAGFLIHRGRALSQSRKNLSGQRLQAGWGWDEQGLNHHLPFSPLVLPHLNRPSLSLLVERSARMLNTPPAYTAPESRRG